MCGLVIAPHRYDDALKAIAHRGLKTTEAYVRKGWIGHSRLPIVGLSTEYDQPVSDDRWIIAFVGEVLNFREVDPDAECDTPLVVDTFQKYGPGGFRNFDGFWSVAALDTRTGDIHLLVDYLCQKPLYYRTDLRVAASEPYAVALTGPTTPDEVYLSAVVKWGYCPETWRTPYREIRKMRPGEYVVLKADGNHRFSLVDELRPGLAIEDLPTEMEKAVRRRVLSSDVPVAALVSGGLDSAIVYAFAKRYGDVRAYHVENGETENARKVLGDKFTLVDLDKDIDMTAAVEIMQEPIDLGSLIPQIALSRAINERVCLTGDGADEFFGGYGRAKRYDSQGSDVWHELVAWHLPRLDRVMMRRRIEVRSPFLARNVCRIALGLPYKARIDKRALRHLFRDDLPEGVVDTPKKALRTETVLMDREQVSRALVEIFRRTTWQ